jgi:hypothetical protein
MDKLGIINSGYVFVIVAKVIIIKNRRQRGILVCSLSYKVAEPIYQQGSNPVEPFRSLQVTLRT